MLLILYQTARYISSKYAIVDEFDIYIILIRGNLWDVNHDVNWLNLHGLESLFLLIVSSSFSSSSFSSLLLFFSSSTSSFYSSCHYSSSSSYSSSFRGADEDDKLHAGLE